MPRSEHRPLTDATCQSLKPGTHAIDRSDARQPGLIFSVLPSGKKQFAVRFRFGGKQVRMLLGDYSTKPGGLTLSKARERAAAEMVLIRQGRNRAAEVRAVKQRPTDDVAALVADYEKRSIRASKTTIEDARMFRADLLPLWKDRSVASLTRRDVRALVDRVVDRGSPVAANRLLGLIKRLLYFAVEHDWIEVNVAARIEPPSPETSRDRVLSDDELRKLWRCLTNPPLTVEKPAPGRKSKRRKASDNPRCPVSDAVAQALRVQLLTAQRPGEVAGMRWADVDLDAALWIIPSADTKNGEPHRVPLSADVVTLLKARLPKKGKPEKPLVFAGVGESIADNAKKAPSRLSAALGFQMTRHDLRRTSATLMTRAGVPVSHVARVLNHIDGPRVTRIYDRHSYDAEKRIALDTLARTLRAILDTTESDEKSADVVPFSRKSR